MSSYLSQGVERLLRTLEPHGRPEGDASFPPPSRRTEMLPRTNGNESIADWFVNAVDTALDGNPEACTIEPNLGVFASIKWKAATRLTFVQMQTVVCNKPLTELYETSRDPRQWDESIKTYYLRLDYDLLALGGIYSHPHPHVHVSPWKFALRFPPDTGAEGNVLVDFIDFVYRNFFHDTWLDWARLVWERAVKERGYRDTFATVSEAFRKSKVDVLLHEPYRQSLAHMKASWRRSRDALFPLRIPREISQLLSLHA